MGRHKGYIMSDFQKQRISEGVSKYYKNLTPEQKAIQKKKAENLKAWWAKLRELMNGGSIPEE